MNQNYNINLKDSKLKKIIYILDNFPKISETFILNEICHLIDLGLDINIISLNDPQEQSINEQYVKYNLKTKTLYCKVEELTELNNKLIKAIEGAQLIHAHFAHNAALAAARVASTLKLPFTVTIHAYEIFRKDCFDKNRVQNTCDLANLIFTPSLYNKKFIQDIINVNPEKIKVVRATIDHHRFKNTHINVDDRKNYKLIYCGRLVDKKGIEYLIQAVSQLRNSRGDFFLKILGHGPLETSLKSLTDELNANSFITFLGEQTNEVFLKELKNSDVFISPCIISDNGDRDVCPLTIQEAMAMTVPVITTNIASIPELIENQVSGILVKQKSSEELKNAIDNLLNNREERVKLVLNARKKIEEEFNNTLQTNRLLTFWNELL